MAPVSWSGGAGGEAGATRQFGTRAGAVRRERRGRRQRQEAQRRAQGKGRGGASSVACTWGSSSVPVAGSATSRPSDAAVDAARGAHRRARAQHGRGSAALGGVWARGRGGREGERGREGEGKREKGGKREKEREKKEEREKREKRNGRGEKEKGEKEREGGNASAPVAAATAAGRPRARDWRAHEERRR
ncbi:hypothetical protein GQ55_2G311400 [Panicum hallii var. hallii]|uniref:Uncharacterized protein n=1 Tax=Panicum hallii var. hallii TaxID=1504633 RepID=A0A2T7EUB2_9POAL|nr:hypothetical protein GQ55_2G311400 [Panicum hallii var. hallii]